jgi:rhodanese-related sulfurtransferase
MNKFLGCTLIGLVLPLGLFLTACSRSHHNEYRTESSTSSSRIVGEPVASDGTVSADRDTSSSEVRESTREDRPSETHRSGSQFDVSLDDIREHVRNNSAVIIDARSAEDFARGHVRGAINVPASQKESAAAQVKRNVATDQLIIIYCGSPQCPAGESVYEYLLSQGYTNMRVFKPGWKTLSQEKDLH